MRMRYECSCENMRQRSKFTAVVVVVLLCYFCTKTNAVAYSSVTVFIDSIDLFIGAAADQAYNCANLKNIQISARFAGVELLESDDSTVSSLECFERGGSRASSVLSSAILINRGQPRVLSLLDAQLTTVIEFTVNMTTAEWGIKNGGILRCKHDVLNIADFAVAHYFQRKSFKMLSSKDALSATPIAEVHFQVSIGINDLAETGNTTSIPCSQTEDYCVAFKVVVGVEMAVIILAVLVALIMLIQARTGCSITLPSISFRSKSNPPPPRNDEEEEWPPGTLRPRDNNIQMNGHPMSTTENNDFNNRLSSAPSGSDASGAPPLPSKASRSRGLNLLAKKKPKEPPVPPPKEFGVPGSRMSYPEGESYYDDATGAVAATSAASVGRRTPQPQPRTQQHHHHTNPAFLQPPDEWGETGEDLYYDADNPNGPPTAMNGGGAHHHAGDAQQEDYDDFDEADRQQNTYEDAADTNNGGRRQPEQQQGAAVVPRSVIAHGIKLM